MSDTNTALEFTVPFGAAEKAVFTDSATSFLADLVARFQPQRDALLARRKEWQKNIDGGALPDFLPETKKIRDSEWKIQGIPGDLLDRRVEITGPVDRKMVINALNANVKVFMADFEDALSPTWRAVCDGQINLRDAVQKKITFTNDKGKEYKLNDKTAVLICRVRGIHLPEKHVLWQGKPIAGCLLDFAMYFHHNYITLMDNKTGPYFYIPKLQSYEEAAWWDAVFAYTEDKYNLARGTIKATVLIETLPAVFQMNEILYSMRDHIVALNCGRWDYIFSYIKTLKSHPDRVLPDRQVVTMDKPFLSAYSKLLIKTCHRRGAMAMGGMAAFIPSKDAKKNAEVLDKVRDDKLREAHNGHDGTWVAHPGLADTAMAVFDEVLGARPNQLEVMRENDAPTTAAQLLEVCDGERTESGMRQNIRVSLQYIEAWISGNGCVPIYGLMEDAATAEISRASIWQWMHNGKTLSNGKAVTKELFNQFLKEEMEVVKGEIGAEQFNAGRFAEAAKLLADITTADELMDFLTLPGYELLD